MRQSPLLSIVMLVRAMFMSLQLATLFRSVIESSMVSRGLTFPTWIVVAGQVRFPRLVLIGSRRLCNNLKHRAWANYSFHVSNITVGLGESLTCFWQFLTIRKTEIVYDGPGSPAWACAGKGPIEWSTGGETYQASRFGQPLQKRQFKLRFY